MMAPEKPPLPEAYKPHVAFSRERSEARARDRKANPGADFSDDGSGAWRVEPPHKDAAAWELMLADILGTSSGSFMSETVYSLRDTFPQAWDGERPVPDAPAVSAGLAIITGAKAENEIEASIALHMAKVDAVLKQIVTRPQRSGGRLTERDAATVARLARTFAQSAETLARLQGRSAPQQINVTYEVHKHEHKHLHHHDARSVHIHEGGGSVFGGQPDEASAACLADGLSSGKPTIRPTVSRSYPGRVALPKAGDQGEASMPASRMRQRGGGSQR